MPLAPALSENYLRYYIVKFISSANGNDRKEAIRTVNCTNIPLFVEISISDGPADSHNNKWPQANSFEKQYKLLNTQ